MAVVLSVEVNKNPLAGAVKKVAGASNAQYVQQTAPIPTQGSAASQSGTSVKVSKTGFWPVAIAVGAVLVIGMLLSNKKDR